MRIAYPFAAVYFTDILLGMCVVNIKLIIQSSLLPELTVKHLRRIFITIFYLFA